MPLTNEAYIAQLEQDKAELLTQIENYAKEQAAKVIIFNDQKKLLDEKNKQWEAQEQQLEESEELITKLKTRISQLAKAKKSYATTVQSDSDNENEDKKIITKVNATTQTEGLNPQQLEEQLLEKRLDNLKDFGSYQIKLEEKDQLIKELQQRLRKLKTLPHHTSEKEKNAVIIFLLVILTSVLFLK